MSFTYQASHLNDHVVEFMKRQNLNTQGLGVDNIRVYISATNTIVACSFIQFGKDFSEIFVFGVDGDYRRQGIGTRFANEIIQELRLSGVGEIGIEPMDEVSANFWYSLGFRGIPYAFGNYGFLKMHYFIN